MRRRVKRWAAAVVVLLGVDALRIAACVSTSRDDAEARLAAVARRIEEKSLPGLAPGHPFDGEWQLVALSMAVVAATNLAVRFPDSKAERAAQVSAWTKRLADADVRAYDVKEWGSDPLELSRADGHAGYLGHLALALGAACVLGAPRDEALHRDVVDALARRLEAAPTGLIETYPGETYMPDNVVALAGIAQFDRCVGEPRHAATISRWLSVAKARWLDPDNGLLVFAPGQPARGSGAAWNAFYLRFVDEAFAADQVARTWVTFGDEALVGALAGIRERPRGVDLPGDVDSGPLVLGVSPSATGFMLAAARLDDDERRVRQVLTTAELVGFSVGLSERSYALSPLVGDAIVLAAKTATRWPAPATRTTSRGSCQSAVCWE